MRDVNPIRSEDGSALIEFALTFALFSACMCMALDLALVSFRQAILNEAVYRAARKAVVENAILEEAVPRWETQAARKTMGDPCAGGNVCPAIDLTCDGSSRDPCADTPQFEALVSEIRKLAPDLDRSHLSVAYRSAHLGFVGRPGGVPLLVTVRIVCAPAKSIFIYRFLPWRKSDIAACDANQMAGGVLGATATLVSEDLTTN